MATIGAFEAKTHLSAILDRVAQGEQITITKRGVAVATLIPAGPVPGKNLGKVAAELKEFGRGRSLPAGMSIRDMIEEGRRF